MNDRSQRIPIAFRTLQQKRNPVSARLLRIGQESDTGAGTIRHPQVQVAISVPVRNTQRAGIRWMVESCDRRGGREGAIARLEEDAIALSATPRSTLVQQFADRIPRSQIRLSGGCFTRIAWESKG